MKTYTISTDTRSFLENIPIPLAVYQYIEDQIKPILVSKAYIELFGYNSCQEAVYSLGTNLYRNVHPEDIARMEKYSYQFSTTQESYDIIFRNKREDQSDYHFIHGTGKYILVDGAKLAFITYTDESVNGDNDSKIKAVLTTISKQYASSDSIEFAKYYDHLTGMQNMTHFLDHSMTGIEKIWKKGQIPVILYFDLCNLKKYNSQYGLKAGDKQICHLAKQIGKYFDKEKTSRFESDHFVVYAENDQIESKLHALFSAMKKGNDENNLAVKVGIFKFNNDGTRLTDACDRARLACDSITSTTASQFVWYDKRILKKTSLEFYIIRNFEKALQKGWIQVWYQPIVRTITKSICNQEALVRWMDPTYGMLSPGQFIPILEDTNQIYQLDLYVFEQACKDYRRMKTNGHTAVPVSINFSRKDFMHDDLPDVIDKISQKYGVPREFTNIEITESAFVKNIDHVKPSIQRFHQLGYKVWMDDFGAGYSSLGVLKDYSFDELKLDMSFLKTFNEKTKNIISAIVRMSKKLEISTLAEGVETEEQYLFLQKIGCEKIQGFYFGRPMPMAQLPLFYKQKELIVEQAKWRAYLTKLSRIDYLTDKPLCVIEDDGTQMHLYFVNEAYMNVLKKDNVHSIKDWVNKINTIGDPIQIFHRQYANQQLRKHKGPQTASYPSGDHYMQLTGAVEARQEDRYLYTVHIQYVDIKAENVDPIRMETISNLYYMCNDIAIYDLENNTVEGIKSSLSDQPMGMGVELNLSKVVNAWKVNYCYLPDQERFAEFMNIATLKTRLKYNKDQVLTGWFRSITASGAYRWFLHIIVPIQRSNFNKALHVTLEAGLRECDLVKIASSLSSLVYNQQKNTNITGEILWKNILMNAKTMYFWKDKQRRFVGVSQSFLKYYGIHSEKELIGKTDEDMMWHITPEPFKNDEEEVLKTGKPTYLKKGKCIANGVNRNIFASKIPVYQDGNIIGILGTAIDADEMKDVVNEQNEQFSIDPVTGLGNANSLSSSIHFYLSEYWRAETDFAMVKVYIPEYHEVVKLYGQHSGDCLLQKIGLVLKNCIHTGCVVGRIQDSIFYLLMHFDNKEDVRKMARQIRLGIESIRKADQWSGNCSAIITAVYSDDSTGNINSYITNVFDTILISKHHEKL